MGRAREHPRRTAAPVAGAGARRRGCWSSSCAVRRRCTMRVAARDRPSDRECPYKAPAVQQEEETMNSRARRMFELVEPIGVIPYSADEPNEAMFALGFTNYWDTYFAGRAAPL